MEQPLRRAERRRACEETAPRSRPRLTGRPEAELLEHATGADVFRPAFGDHAAPRQRCTHEPEGCRPRLARIALPAEAAADPVADLEIGYPAQVQADAPDERLPAPPPQAEEAILPAGILADQGARRGEREGLGDEWDRGRDRGIVAERLQSFRVFGHKRAQRETCCRVGG